MEIDQNRYRLMDEEECEEFTDVYWIKFSSISNASYEIPLISLCFWGDFFIFIIWLGLSVKCQIRQKKTGRLPLSGPLVASHVRSKFWGCARHSRQTGREEKNRHEQTKKYCSFYMLTALSLLPISLITKAASLQLFTSRRRGRCGNSRVLGILYLSLCQKIGYRSLFQCQSGEESH